MFCAIVAAIFLVRKRNFTFGEKFANFNKLHHKNRLFSLQRVEILNGISQNSVEITNHTIEALNNRELMKSGLKN
jgi:hypothetical protein